LPSPKQIVRSNILNFQAHEIAASQFAVDCQVKHRKVAQPALDLQLCAYRPDLLVWSGGLEPSNLPLFHGTLGVVSVSTSWKVCMAELLY
jgi:hypothetical protein